MPVTPLHISFLCAFVQTWIYTHPYAKNRSFKSSRSRKQWQRMKGSKNDWEEKKNNTLIYSPRKWNVQARKRSGLSAIQGLGTRIPPSPFLPCAGPMGSRSIASRYLHAPSVPLGSGAIKTDGPRTCGWVWRQVYEPNGVFQVPPLQIPSRKIPLTQALPRLWRLPCPLHPSYLSWRLELKHGLPVKHYDWRFIFDRCSSLEAKGGSFFSVSSWPGWTCLHLLNTYLSIPAMCQALCFVLRNQDYSSEER